MALLKPPPPPASAAAFSAQLPTFLSGPGGLGNRHSAGSPAAMPSPTDIGSAPPEAQEVYFLSLKDAAHNSGVISPKSVGWRFFAGGASPSPMVIGRVIQHPSSAAWKTVAVFYGPVVNDEMDASNGLTNLPQLQTGNYHLRALEVPGLNFKAFWLKALKAGIEDLIVPFPSGPAQLISGLKGAGSYSMSHFLAVIRPLASSNLAITGKYGA